MLEYIRKWGKKVHCIYELDMESIPQNETVVIGDDGEHFVTVRRENSVNVYSIRTIDGETIIEALEYVSNGKIEVVKTHKNHTNIELHIVFTQAIKNKGNSRHAKKDDVFGEVPQLLHHLREQADYLNDDENHQVHTSIPNDIKEMKRVYESLLPDEKEEAREWINETKSFIVQRLEELKEKVKKRKTNLLEKKFRVVKMREEDRY